MTIMFRLFIIALFLVFALVAPFVLAQSKPEKVPADIIEEADGTVTVYKGTCPFEDKVMLCMLGLHEAKRTAWMLLFNEHGVLVIIQSQVEGAEVKTRWKHPHYEAKSQT